jgi:hypothetical protein
VVLPVPSLCTLRQTPNCVLLALLPKVFQGTLRFLIDYFTKLSQVQPSNSTNMSFMASLRSNHLFQTALRVLQFLSAIISLGLFSARLAKIVRLVGRASTSNGAVEGILAAAVIYTLTMMIVKFLAKGRGASVLRWLMAALDVLFVGAFIAVAYLTRPHGGSSGPCRKTVLRLVIPKGLNCNLPYGTFALAIISM